MIVLKHDKDGTWVLIDPDAIYIRPVEGGGPIRCISANKLEDLGMYIDKQPACRIGHVPRMVITECRGRRAPRVGFYSNPRAVRIK